MKSDQQCTGLKINVFAFEKVQIGISGIKSKGGHEKGRVER